MLRPLFSKKFWIFFSFGFAIVSQPLLTQAGLGDRVGSLEKDRKAVSGSFSGSENRLGYKIDTIVNKHLTIKEYSAGGIIFGVTWTGIRHPDLTGLLSTHLGDYQQSLATTKKNRGMRSFERVRGQRVVVEKSGHMRWIQGKAFVPDLMPVGLSADEIR